ncbi:uncharacterized protein METZ01_LOCUS483034, partial [marine metagenome]
MQPVTIKHSLVITVRIFNQNVPFPDVVCATDDTFSLHL